MTSTPVPPPEASFLAPTDPLYLPDLVRPGLRLLFIGINPGIFSAQVGHYYARPGNWFWWAFSHSGIRSAPAGPENDRDLLAEGIGFTDVVKRPTASSGDLRQEEFDEGAKRLVKTLETYQPQVACFIGLLGAAAFFGRKITPGPLPDRLGATRFFAIPSPSRRNAHYGQDRMRDFFCQLRQFLDDGNAQPTVPNCPA